MKAVRRIERNSGYDFETVLNSTLCYKSASITKASLQSFAVFIFFDIDFVIISFSGVVVAVVAV